jgi:hypothetical protein
VRSVEQLTGLGVDHLVVADLGGFSYLTDRLVEQPLLDDGAVTTAAAETLEYLGQPSDPPQEPPPPALGPRELLRSLSNEMRSSDLGDPRRLRFLLAAATRSVAVDKSLTTARLRALAQSLAHVDSENITRRVVPMGGTGEIADGPAAHLEPGGTDAVPAAR